MPSILSMRHRPVLDQFAGSNVLVAFDYDGTLAPIVRDPKRATLRRRTKRLLTTVANRYPCAVISGRSLADLRERLHDVPVWHVAGNHGAEPGPTSTESADRLREWVTHLRKRLRPHRGVVVEDKVFSIAVDYRRANPKRPAIQAIIRAVNELEGLRRLDGKQAINLLPDGAPDKGVALERLRIALACDFVIYVGDDDTDEDAFTAGSADRLLSIRVGRDGRRRSAARFHLESQRQIDALLSALARLRRETPRRNTRGKFSRN